MIDQELDLVGTAFADVHLDGDAGDVIARGRTLRRRRKAVPALATAGILAASLSLAVVTQSSAPSSPSVAGSAGSHTLGYHGAVVNMDEAGFSVHTDAKTGTVTLTIAQLFDPSELKAVLAKAGIRAVIHAFPDATSGGELGLCAWTGAKQLPSAPVIGFTDTKNDNVFTIHPAEMPAGSVIAFSSGGGIDGQPGVGMQPALFASEPTACVD